MAANDVQVRKHGLTVMKFDTEANVRVGIEAGDAIKGAAGTGTNFVDVCLDGDPEQETDMFLGISTSASTATASANGELNVELCIPGTIMEASAHTTSNIDTEAKLLALKFDQVTFNRSAATAAGTLTVNENEGTDTDVHGLLILDGDVVEGTILFTLALTHFGLGFGEVTQS